MTTANRGLTRRHVLAATGAGVLAAGFGARPAFALETVRQGYQTNMWGMPTYYLLRSGLLEKHGVKFEEFAVPSGNLTMQQMVARQVDMGTYAGPSFAIGHDKGGLVAIAMIEYVGKTARVMARKDLGTSPKSSSSRARRSPTRPARPPAISSSTRSRPRLGLKKGDYQEIRMNVNDMVAAMAAKTVDAMVNVEPYNAIAEADGLADHDLRFLRFRQAAGVHGGDAGISSTRIRTPWWPISRPGSKSPRTLNQNPKKVADTIYSFYTSKGYTMSTGHLRQGACARRGRARLAVRPYALHDSPCGSSGEGQQAQGHSGLE